MADSVAPAAPAAPASGGYIPLPSAPVGGRRKMKKVSAKTIKRTLKKLGMKPKGRVVIKGGDMEEPAAAPAAAPAAPVAGRRRHGGKTKRSASKKRRASSIFGL